MAKDKRPLLGLVCSKCQSQNYVTEKSKINTPDPLEIKKYCPRCRKHTLHKEKKKLK